MTVLFSLLHTHTHSSKPESIDITVAGKCASPSNYGSVRLTLFTGSYG